MAATRACMTFGAAAALLTVLSAEARAQELRIGIGAEATTMDPHFYNLTPNIEVNEHIFDYLVHTDAKSQVKPGLALSWSLVNETTWEFKLRPGVVFHDGTPLKADDVAFTFDRAPKVPNTPASYSQFLRRITAVTAVDDATVRVTTDGPNPMVVRQVSNVAIVSRKHGTGATTNDYNFGKAAIGTGPYKLAEWVPADRLVLVRNDNYWGEKPKWSRVTMKPISNATARSAAVLAGDVDLINFVPSVDIEKLKKTPNLSVVTEVGSRLFYMMPDVGRAQSPFVTDKAGTPLPKNPLQDVRVRRALSKAIDRTALVERVMDGAGAIAGQFLPDGSYGVTPKLKPEAYDPEGAKKLLAEAGYPDGFGLTVHGTNDRYLNDARVVQTVGQMLSRIGITTKVEALPKANYFTRASNRDFSFFLIGTGTNDGETTSLVLYILASYDEKKGLGNGNRSRYSNPKVDELIGRSLVEMNESKREMLLREATEIGLGQDQAIIPMFFEVNTWALKKGLTYTARTDGRTTAMDVR